MEKEPLIIVISGPSGSGKNSVVDALRKLPNRFIFSISCTTRKEIRPGEVDGKDYFFLSDEEFDKTIKEDGFLEWQPIHQYRYGTRKKDFDRLRASGKHVVMVIDVKGMVNVKKMYKNVLTFFVIPPSLEELENRLNQRRTEDPESLRIRKARYLEELSYRDQYDYVIVNDNLETAQLELLEAIMKHE